MMMCLFALNRRPSITAESCDFGLIAAASCAAVPVATTETKIAAPTSRVLVLHVPDVARRPDTSRAPSHGHWKNVV